MTVPDPRSAASLRRSPSVAIVGGGPGGLLLARLLRLRDRRARVRVYERNDPDATFGFGVVFSDRTLCGFLQADPRTHRRIVESSIRWTDMEFRLAGTTIRYTGFGFSAIARRTLLRILQEAAEEVGAELQFHTEVGLDVAGDADVVVASDGVNSSIRAALAPELGFSRRTGSAKFVWFGTTARFDAVTFPFVRTQHGVFAAHAYPYDANTGTFVAEVDGEAWRRAGMDSIEAEPQSPGSSDLASKAYLEDAFADHLGSEPLLVNNSRWSSFAVVSNRRWSHGKVVLLGDAAHTAHFSVGSGTKMAMEDAIALADSLHRQPDAGTAFAAYEHDRRPPVERTQRWAEMSQRWWETFGRRLSMRPEQFVFHFMTRTDAMTYRGLRRRDRAAVNAAESTFRDSGRGSALSVPLQLGERCARNRLMVPAPAGSTSDVTEGLGWAGAGIVLVDLDDHDSADAARRIRATGALAGARLTHASPDMVRAVAGDFDVIELTLGDALRNPSAVAELAPAAGPVPVLLELDAARLDAWSPDGDDAVHAGAGLRGAGVTGIRIIGADLERGLALADRLRTEAGLLVALTVPSGWLGHAPGDTGEDLPTRVHTALVSGRLDLLASWPLPLPQTITATARRGGDA